jgi:hypothetical protein
MTAAHNAPRSHFISTSPRVGSDHDAPGTRRPLRLAVLGTHRVEPWPSPQRKARADTRNWDPAQHTQYLSLRPTLARSDVHRARGLACYTDRWPRPRGRRASTPAGRLAASLVPTRSSRSPEGGRAPTLRCLRCRSQRHQPRRTTIQVGDRADRGAEVQPAIARLRTSRPAWEELDARWSARRVPRPRTRCLDPRQTQPVGSAS